MPPSAPERLVLFDVDGTLLWSDGSGRAAMQIALEQVYGTAGPINAYNFAGRTDHQSVADLLTAGGVPADVIWERFEQLGEVMTAELEQRVAQGLHHIRACPGAVEMVEALHRHTGVLLGLLTGNLAATAHIKLRAAGIDPALFRLGAYGDVSSDRGDLPPLAVAEAFRLTGVKFEGSQIVIVGDTPYDVLCGAKLGARSLIVLTGHSSRGELLPYRPEYLFDDLSDTATVLDAVFASA